MSATTDVRERPILFSAPMIRALLDGTKTQTRRVVKLPGWSLSGCDVEIDADGMPCIVAFASRCLAAIPCPYGAIGDRLWVRETWTAWATVGAGDQWRFKYAADGAVRDLHVTDEDWSPPKALRYGEGNASPFFLKRWASRLTLELTDVRGERLQDISEADAQAEGVKPEPYQWRPLGSTEPMRDNDHRHEFATLWDSLNHDRGFGWDVNPWVWCLTFRRVPA